MKKSIEDKQERTQKVCWQTKQRFDQNNGLIQNANQIIALPI
jgi:hypothetical protein